MSDGGPTPPRRFAVALAAVPLLALGLVDATTAIRNATDSPAKSGSTQATPAAARNAPVTTRADQSALSSRAVAIRGLLARRSHALLHHDRAEWASILDPTEASFRASQLAVFDNVQKVPFASWSYSFDASAPPMSDIRSQRYGVESYAPRSFTLRYRLQGFDLRPTNLQQYPTFVHRGSQWLLASMSDFNDAGSKSALDLWDFGPVVTVRTPTALVLGHPGSLGLMRGVATEIAADIPRVSKVWGTGWSRRAVVLVPSTQRELGRVVDDYGDLDHIAAVATAEVSIGSGRPNPVGDRIGINPGNWPKLSGLGRRIVLTHELTHVATRAVTSSATPVWLAEGFADYVGYLDSGIPAPFVAQDLGNDVRAGHVPQTLPRAQQFAGASKTLSQAYEGAWMACSLLANTYGQPALVRFYRAVGTSSAASSAALAAAFTKVFHTTTRAFVGTWRDYLRTSLG